MSYLKRALSVQAHLRHGYQHLFVDELRLSLGLNLLTLCYQLVRVEEKNAREERWGEENWRCRQIVMAAASAKYQMSNFYSLLDEPVWSIYYILRIEMTIKNS